MADETEKTEETIEPAAAPAPAAPASTEDRLEALEQTQHELVHEVLEQRKTIARLERAVSNTSTLAKQIVDGEA